MTNNSIHQSFLYPPPVLNPYYSKAALYGKSLLNCGDLRLIKEHKMIDYLAYQTIEKLNKVRPNIRMLIWGYSNMGKTMRAVNLEPEDFCDYMIDNLQYVRSCALNKEDWI